MLLVLLDVKARTVLSPVETTAAIIHHLSSSRHQKEAAAALRTAGPIAVVAEVALVKAALDACLLPHLVDLGYAHLRVGSEKQLSRLDREVVLGPVPQVLELMVVKGGEGVHAGDTQQRTQRERQHGSGGRGNVYRHARATAGTIMDRPQARRSDTQHHMA